MTPLLYAIGAGIVIAIASVAEKLGLHTVQPYAALFVRAGAIFAFLGLSLVPFGRTVNWTGFSPRAVIFLAVGGLLAGLIAHFLYWQSLKATTPAYALPIMMGVSQATVVLLTFTLLRTSISLGQVVGVALVIIGIVLIQVLK